MLLRHWLMLATWLAAGCATPALTRDGQLVFSEEEQSGATVLTANGIEIVDRTTIYKPRVRKSAFEPWEPPTGFLLPADGVLRHSADPVALQGHGLAVVLRPSDHVVPTWGGEILLRLDTLVPKEAFQSAAPRAREPVRLSVVLDDDSRASSALVDELLGAVGRQDRIVVVDSGRGGRVVLPPMPGRHRALIRGAIEGVLKQRARHHPPNRSLARALDLARTWLARGATNRRRAVLVLTDGEIARGASRTEESLAALLAEGAAVTVVASQEGSALRALERTGARVVGLREDARRKAAMSRVLPPPGGPVLLGVELEFSSAPAPVHIVEASDGEVSMTLEGDRLMLGDLCVEEARTELVRLTVPQWVADEPWVLSVTARYRDRSSGRRLRSRRRLSFRYSEDVSELAELRHGDVIAYASALAMVDRLESAFLGAKGDEPRSLPGVVLWQARSLALLAASERDPALAEQAEALSALASALRD